ncbi:sortase [Patescibacteria group bacterium]|nr:MAG: sortase [Patescibacteria group bacterium]
MSAITKTFSKIPLLIRVVSLYIVIGVISWSSLQIQQLFAVAPAPIIHHAPIKPKVLSQQIISGEPVSFVIDRLHINLPVKDGTYDPKTGEWTLSTDAVYFATITSQPNDNRGNTFIYGHNQDKVIARMKDIQPGDTVVITTSNGHVFTYAYTHDSIVAPDFTDALKQDSDTPQLTVMTCEGVWSNARRMMYFDLIGVV